MATVIAGVTDCRSFWREIVVPDYNDFNAAIDNIRRAFHCAISLFHLCDWVYHVHRPYIDANFSYRDRNGVVRPVTDEKTFANALGDLHPDFDLIRGIANSAKHLVLTNRRPHPASPSHAANTRVQSTGFGEGGYGMGPYGGTPRVMLEGPGGQDREFTDLAKSTFEMWQRLSQQHNWQLT
jgi:hypothetical protein